MEKISKSRHDLDLDRTSYFHILCLSLKWIEPLFFSYRVQRQTDRQTSRHQDRHKNNRTDTDGHEHSVVAVDNESKAVNLVHFSVMTDNYSAKRG